MSPTARTLQSTLYEARGQRRLFLAAQTETLALQEIERLEFLLRPLATADNRTDPAASTEQAALRSKCLVAGTAAAAVEASVAGWLVANQGLPWPAGAGVAVLATVVVDAMLAVSTYAPPGVRTPDAAVARLRAWVLAPGGLLLAMGIGLTWGLRVAPGDLLLNPMVQSVVTGGLLMLTAGLSTVAPAMFAAAHHLGAGARAEARLKRLSAELADYRALLALARSVLETPSDHLRVA